MILTFDVGNTETVIGLHETGELVDHWRIATWPERTVDEMGVLITLKVNPQDLGQVIGRSGQTAKSIRTLLRVVGAKNHARVNLKIFEPEGYRKSDRMAREGAAPAAPAAVPQAEDTSAVDDLKL